MQTEQTKPEAAPKPKPETRDETKQRLLAIKDHRRTKKESLQLIAIAEEEAAEKKHGALIHKLRERADKWGRREIGEAKKDITKEVGIFSKEESAQLHKEDAAYAKAQKAAQKDSRTEMQQVQERLNANLREITQQHDQVAADIRAEFKPRYEQAELDIEIKTEETAATVANFVEALDSFTTDQLQTLHKEGTLHIGDECIAVPDA